MITGEKVYYHNIGCTKAYGRALSLYDTGPRFSADRYLCTLPFQGCRGVCKAGQQL